MWRRGFVASRMRRTFNLPFGEAEETDAQRYRAAPGLTLAQALSIEPERS
jgi:hypothetical protein